MSHSFAPRAQKLVRKLCLELLKSSKKSAARICRYAARYAAAWSANVLDASLSGSTARVWNNGSKKPHSKKRNLIAFCIYDNIHPDVVHRASFVHGRE